MRPRRPPAQEPDGLFKTALERFIDIDQPPQAPPVAGAYRKIPERPVARDALTRARIRGFLTGDYARDRHGRGLQPPHA